MVIREPGFLEWRGCGGKGRRWGCDSVGSVVVVGWGWGWGLGFLLKPLVDKGTLRGEADAGELCRGSARGGLEGRAIVAVVVGVEMLRVGCVSDAFLVGFCLRGFGTGPGSGEALCGDFACFLETVFGAVAFEFLVLWAVEDLDMASSPCLGGDGDTINCASIIPCTTSISSNASDEDWGDGGRGPGFFAGVIALFADSAIFFCPDIASTSSGIL